MINFNVNFVLYKKKKGRDRKVDQTHKSTNMDYMLMLISSTTTFSIEKMYEK